MIIYNKINRGNSKLQWVFPQTKPEPFSRWFGPSRYGFSRCFFLFQLELRIAKTIWFFEFVERDWWCYITLMKTSSTQHFSQFAVQFPLSVRIVTVLKACLGGLLFHLQSHFKKQNNYWYRIIYISYSWYYICCCICVHLFFLLTWETILESLCWMTIVAVFFQRLCTRCTQECLLKNSYLDTKRNLPYRQNT